MNKHDFHIMYDNSHNDEQVKDQDSYIMYDYSHDDKQVKLHILMLHNYMANY